MPASRPAIGSTTLSKPGNSFAESGPFVHRPEYPSGQRKNPASAGFHASIAASYSAICAAGRENDTGGGSSFSKVTVS